VTTVDDRLRAANAAAAERVHLADLKASLVADVTTHQERVQQLAADLERERADVERMSSGLLGFFGDVLVCDDELSREQREAYEAQVRLRDAVAAREVLRTQLAPIEQRLAELTPTAIETELCAARAAKVAELVECHAPGGAELVELSNRITSLESELLPLEGAISAGDTALDAIWEIRNTLLQAQRPSRKDKHVDRARSLACEAEAKLAVFHRTVDELANPDGDMDGLAKLIAPADRERFIDSWLKLLFSSGIDAACADLTGRLVRLRASLVSIRTQRNELASRRAPLVADQECLLESAQGNWDLWTDGDGSGMERDHT
jgi:hypothetical protein